jgi:hypothetical protein
MMFGEAVDPEKPRRQYLVRLQIFCELMLALSRPDLMLDALERVVHLGLLDLTWMDHNPLIAKVRADARFIALREIVRERASRVHAAFKAAGVS